MENMTYEFVVRRREESIRNLEGWILVYGRRKTGKTFTIRRVFNEAHYFVITRSGHTIAEVEGRVTYISLEEAVKQIGALLKDEKMAVLDEFQRLPYKYWDAIALCHPNGKLIASGSSLGILRKVFDRRSPLLGLFTPFRFDLIRYSDAILSIKDLCPFLREALLWGLLIRDPWIIPMVCFERDMVSEICNKAYGLLASASGLVGEVFEEEERALTRVYDAVLRLTGESIWKPAEISGILTSNNLISGGLPTVDGLLNRLAGMGLLEKVVLWKTKGAKYYFKHRSPLLSILYYLDQKLHIGEGFHKKIDPNLVMSVIGMEFQFAVGEMLAEYMGGIKGYTILPNMGGDIDIVILDPRLKRPIIGYEVKIGEFEKREAEKAVEKIHNFGIPKAGLISASARPPSVAGSYEELGPEELFKIAEQASPSNHQQTGH